MQKDVFWSKDILLFEAKGPGSKLWVPFDVPADGRYELVAQVAHSPDYGTYMTQLDGQPVGSAETLEHEPGANVGDAGRSMPTSPRLTSSTIIESAGRSSRRAVTADLRMRQSGQRRVRYNLRLDTFVLASLTPAAALAANGEQAEEIKEIADHTSASAAGGARAEAALRDSDAEVRAAGAWTLGQLTNAPRSSIEALTRALGNADLGCSRPGGGCPAQHQHYGARQPRCIGPIPRRSGGRGPVGRCAGAGAPARSGCRA